MNLSVFSLSHCLSELPVLHDSFLTTYRRTSFNKCKFSRFALPSLILNDVKNKLSVKDSIFNNFLSTAVVLGSDNVLNTVSGNTFYTGRKFFYDATPTIFKRCVFFNCIARGNKRFFSDGGAIQAIMTNDLVLPKDFNLKITECGFYKCIASGRGGAVCVDSVSITTEKTLFKNCSSTDGAFYVKNCTSESINFKDTYWGGVYRREKSKRQFGISFESCSINIFHANFTRGSEPEINGLFISGKNLIKFDLKYTFVSHVEGATIFNLDQSESNDNMLQFAVFKVANAKTGIIFVDHTKSPFKCRDFVFIRCTGMILPNTTTNSYVLDNWYIEQLPKVIDSDTKKGLEVMLDVYKKIKISAPNFNVSFPKGADWEMIKGLEKAMITPTQVFSPSLTFLPSESFTPSCTLSGILFIRDNKRWYAYRKSVKTVIVANSAPILAGYLDVL